MQVKLWAIAGTLAFGSLVATPLSAKDDDSKTPEVFNKVIACRDITDNAARLACFDGAVGALAQAQQDKDVVVVSREEMRKTRRGLFGFVLPKLGLFGGGNDDENDAEEIKEITATIASFGGGTGHYVFTLDDGAVWEQTEGEYLKWRRRARRSSSNVARWAVTTRGSMAELPSG